MGEIGRDDKFELKVVGMIGCLFWPFDFRLYSIVGIVGGDEMKRQER